MALGALDAIRAFPRTSGLAAFDDIPWVVRTGEARPYANVLLRCGFFF